MTDTTNNSYSNYTSVSNTSTSTSAFDVWWTRNKTTIIGTLFGNQVSDDLKKDLKKYLPSIDEVIKAGLPVEYYEALKKKFKDDGIVEDRCYVPLPDGIEINVIDEKLCIKKDKHGNYVSVKENEENSA